MYSILEIFNFIRQVGHIVPPPVSSGIPKNPGIPGLDFNPDPGIIENTIPGFFGILV